MLYGIGLTTLSALSFSARAQAPSTSLPPEVAENEPTAQALGFHKDASKVDSKKWTKHAGAEGKKQNCQTCQLYVASKDKPGKGGCTLFQARLVPANGWCNGWIAKAG